MMASLASVGLILLFASLTYAVGALLLRRVGGWTGALEKAIFAIPIGMGVVSYLILALGLLRLFHPAVFYGILALGVIAAPFAIVDLRRARNPTVGEPRSRLGLIVGVLLAILGVCIVIAALAPPTEWDALSYHLAGPQTYLRNGRIFYIPYDHHTNFPFLLQMLYTLMLGVGSVGGAKLCHTLCGALLIASVYTFARRYVSGIRGQRVGAIAVLILATTPMALWEMTVAYADLATALYTWLGFYGLMNAVVLARTSGQVGGRSHPLPLPRSGRGESGNAEGKDEIETRVGVLDSPLPERGRGRGWGACALAHPLRRPHRLRARHQVHRPCLLGVAARRLRRLRLPANATLVADGVATAALWVVVSLVVAAPWYFKTYLYTGNPTYPFLYGLFGGRYWSAENAAKYAVSQSQLGGEKSLIGLLTVPWESTMLPDAAFKHFTEYFTFNLSPVYLGMLMALPLIGRRLSRPVFVAGLFGLGVGVFWFASVQQTRYLLPAFPALALVCAEAVVILWETHARFERWAAAGLVALSAAWGIYVAGGMAFWGVREYSLHKRVAGPAWPVVTGQVSRDEYLAHLLPGIAPAELWINENTPPDAKVAMFDLERGFYLDRDYLWAQPDHADGLIPWNSYRDADDWLADFKRRGYTTLLVGARDPAVPDDHERWRTLLDDAVRGDKVTPVYEAPGMRGADDQPIFVRVYRIP